MQQSALSLLAHVSGARTSHTLPLSRTYFSSLTHTQFVTPLLHSRTRTLHILTSLTHTYTRTHSLLHTRTHSLTTTYTLIVHLCLTHAQALYSAHTFISHAHICLTRTRNWSWALTAADCRCTAGVLASCLDLVPAAVSDRCSTKANKPQDYRRLGPGGYHVIQTHLLRVLLSRRRNHIKIYYVYSYQTDVITIKKLLRVLFSSRRYHNIMS